MLRKKILMAIITAGVLTLTSCNSDITRDIKNNNQVETKEIKEVETGEKIDTVDNEKIVKNEENVEEAIIIEETFQKNEVKIPEPVEVTLFDKLKKVEMKDRIELDKYKEINQYVNGILHSDAIGLHGPIVFYTDNETYLNKNIDGTANVHGSMIRDFYNVNDMLLKIYGHNTHPDYFSKLKNLKIGDTITYTGTQLSTKMYKVVKIDKTDFDTSTDAAPGDRDYVDTSSYLKLLGTEQGFVVPENPHCLTLSTCSNHTADGRLVILAVQVSE